MEASWVGLVEFANQLDPDRQLQGLSDAQVEQEVRDAASRIAAMQCRWLLHLAEFVVRGSWADGGARTPGQWLSWACGEAGSTAREHLRVALALRHLPLIRERFAAGTLSYSKVRAVTRVAVPEIEQQLLDLADSAPASIITSILATSRRSADQRRRCETDGPDELVGHRDVQRVRLDQDMVELRIRLPVDEAVALEERDRSGVDDHLVVLHVDANELAGAVTGPDTEEAASGGDAAEAIVDCVAAPGSDAAAAPGRSHRGAGPRAGRVRAHVTTGRGRGMMLPRSTLAWLTCDADLRLAGIGESGHPADVGRRSRTVPPDLRRALQLRDRHCRFPGCHQTRGLHAHHVRHWARGGPTDLSNLLLLCRHHHRFVHDRDWDLRPVDPRAGRWTFHAPDRQEPPPAVLAMPGASAASLTPIMPGRRPLPTALQPPWWDGAGYDLDETIAIVGDMLLDAAA